MSIAAVPGIEPCAGRKSRDARHDVVGNDGARKTTAAIVEQFHDVSIGDVSAGGVVGVQAYRLLNNIIKDTVTTVSDVSEFREKHRGMIPMLPVAMRKHLEDNLDRIGGNTREAAE